MAERTFTWNNPNTEVEPRAWHATVYSGADFPDLNDLPEALDQAESLYTAPICYIELTPEDTLGDLGTTLHRDLRLSIEHGWQASLHADPTIEANGSVAEIIFTLTGEGVASWPELVDYIQAPFPWTRQEAPMVGSIHVDNKAYSLQTSEIVAEVTVYLEGYANATNFESWLVLINDGLWDLENWKHNRHAIIPGQWVRPAKISSYPKYLIEQLEDEDAYDAWIDGPDTWYPFVDTEFEVKVKAPTDASLTSRALVVEHYVDQAGGYGISRDLSGGACVLLFQPLSFDLGSHNKLVVQLGIEAD